MKYDSEAQDLAQSKVISGSHYYKLNKIQVFNEINKMHYLHYTDGGNDALPGLYNRVRQKLGITSEKAVATHSSTLAWKFPWTEEPGRL